VLIVSASSLPAPSQIVLATPSNWLLHGVISIADVDAALTRMAARVDRQNRHDLDYQPMMGHQQVSPAFPAARAPIVYALSAPNRYVEPVLHRFQLLAKSRPSNLAEVEPCQPPHGPPFPSRW
jgi:malate synthase